MDFFAPIIIIWLLLTDLIPLTAGITVKGTAAIFAGRHRRAFSVFRRFEAEISGETTGTYVGALRYGEHDAPSENALKSL